MAAQVFQDRLDSDLGAVVPTFVYIHNGMQLVHSAEQYFRGLRKTMNGFALRLNRLTVLLTGSTQLLDRFLDLQGFVIQTSESCPELFKVRKLHRRLHFGCL